MFEWVLNFGENRHGIRQVRSGWADGPAYITQCPIQTGQSYVYNFTVTGQRGTLFWHGHISWLRATLYGPVVILPKRRLPYPFPQPFKEVPIVFGNLYKIPVLLFLSFIFGLVCVVIIYPFKRVYIKPETSVWKCRRMVESRHRDSNQPSNANRIGTKCFWCLHH